MFGEYTKGMFTPWQVLMVLLLDMVDVNWSRKEALRKKDAGGRWWTCMIEALRPESMALFSQFIVRLG